MADETTQSPHVETAPETDPAKTEQTPTPQEAAPSPAPVDPAAATTTPPAEQAPAPAKADDPAPTDPWDLLKTDGEKQAESAQKVAAEDAQYAAAAGFGDDAKTESIPLGEAPDGSSLSMDAAQQREFLPYLRAAGVPAEKAQEVVKAFAAREAARIKADIDRDKAETADIWRKTQDTFGESLKQVLSDAQRGALRLFPKDLWEEMRKVPALALDERFLRSLAAHGRSYRNDNGGPPPSDRKAPSGGDKPSFSLDAWSKGSGNGV
jgi:hypothetical protein